VNHKPEDLPKKMIIVPSRAGERARMKKRVQSSRSLLGLGDFLFVYLAREDKLMGCVITEYCPAQHSIGCGFHRG
jgi:hypothetical protein